MPLTDAKIKAAKAKDKQCTLNDGEGLSLIVSPAPPSRFHGKQNTSLNWGGGNWIGVHPANDASLGNGALSVAEKCSLLRLA
jgi:hypothetical protein